MQIKVQVLSVQVSTKQGKKAYQNAEVAFKNLADGKVQSKNITQYSQVFKTAAEATPGSFYDVVTEKNDNGFWEWVKMDRAMDGGALPPTAAPAATNAPAGRTTPYVDNRETAEERAKRQVHIVKQSSLDRAVATLSVGAKAPPNRDDVVALAQFYTDWVFNSNEQEQSITDLFDQENDIPL